MGSAMWMTIRQYGILEEAVRCLKEEKGCLIYASDLNPSANDLGDLVWYVDVEDNDDSDTDNADNAVE